MKKYTVEYMRQNSDAYNKNYEDIANFVKDVIKDKNIVMGRNLDIKKYLNGQELETYIGLLEREKKLNKRGTRIRKKLNIHLKEGDIMKAEKKYEMQNVDWKEIIEHHLVDLYSEKLYNMSLAEVQSEADRVGFDITELFQQK